jgi:trehalose 6-phosphate synthase
VTFLQITPKSRAEVPEYAAIDRTVSTIVGQINGRHGEAAWTPIRYVNRFYFAGLVGGVFPIGSYRPGDAAARWHEPCR